MARGWFKDRPSKVTGRWVGKGVLAIVAGGIAVVVGFSVPISGLVLIGAGVDRRRHRRSSLFATGMPAVTMPGAMIRAMLAAYRRTLQKTMAQARSMQQVVDEAGLDWLDTPDQAVVWGTALGLQHEIEGVLERSLEDVQRGSTARRLRPLLPGLVPGLERRPARPRRPPRAAAAGCSRTRASRTSAG